jgi:hypothetical protein
MGSDSGGQRAAALYSLIGTAKLNGLDPALYLRTVLAQIPEHPINRIEQAPALELSTLMPNRSFQCRLDTQQVSPLKTSGHFQHTLLSPSRGEVWLSITHNSVEPN